MPDNLRRKMLEKKKSYLTYSFAHVVDDLQVSRVGQEGISVYCDVVMQGWHHI